MVMAFPRVQGFLENVWLFVPCLHVFFKVEISLCTLIPLFGPVSVYSGSVSWDDCERAFADNLRVSSFPDRSHTIPGQQHSQPTLTWMGQRCICCNQPPALLRVCWLLFRSIPPPCHCGNMGVEWTWIGVGTQSWFCRKKFSWQLLLGFKLATFQSWVWHFTNKLVVVAFFYLPHYLFLCFLPPLALIALYTIFCQLLHRWLAFCRDPHSTQTLKVFEDSIEWAAKGSFTQQELEQAKISVFQAVSQSVFTWIITMGRARPSINFRSHSNSYSGPKSVFRSRSVQVWLWEHGCCEVGV